MSLLFKDKNLNFEEFEKSSFQDWIKVVTADLKGADYTEKFNWQTLEGISYLPFYENKTDYTSQGIIKSKNDWDICQLISAASISEANKLALSSLEGGASSLLFDLAPGSITSYDDVEILLNNIVLNYITVHFGEYISTETHQKWINKYVDIHYKGNTEVKIYFKNDIFAKAIKTGFLVDINRPQNGYSNAVDAHFYGNAGATMVDQLAFAAASGNEYLGASADKDKIAENIQFSFTIASDYFLEIAKLRAFRLIWARILEQYSSGLGAKYPAYLQAHTATFNTSYIDPHNNILRATTEAMSAAIGGANSIVIVPFDAVYNHENTFSDRISRNIHHLLKEEAYFDKVADPGAGSYFIEELTHKLAQHAWDVFQEIEKQGGMHAAIESGFVQQRILDAQNKRLDAAKNDEISILGVNLHPPKQIDKMDVIQSNKIAPKPEGATEVAVVKEFRIAEYFEKEANQ